MNKMLIVLGVTSALAITGCSSEAESSNEDTESSYKSNPAYTYCYGKMTDTHKETGLHYRNRAYSIKVKEEVCKEAVTTGEGSYWLK